MHDAIIFKMYQKAILRDFLTARSRKPLDLWSLWPQEIGSFILIIMTLQIHFHCTLNIMIRLPWWRVEKVNCFLQCRNWHCKSKNWKISRYAGQLAGRENSLIDVIIHKVSIFCSVVNHCWVIESVLRHLRFKFCFMMPWYMYLFLQQVICTFIWFFSSFFFKNIKSF